MSLPRACVCVSVVRDTGRSGHTHTHTFQYPTSLCAARRRNCTLSCLSQKQRHSRSRCRSAEPTVCVCVCVSARVRLRPVEPTWRPKPPASFTASAAKVRPLFFVCVCVCLSGRHLPEVVLLLSSLSSMWPPAHCFGRRRRERGINLSSVSIDPAPQCGDTRARVAHVRAQA